MAMVSTYLNFTDSTEEAFTFYKTVFGTEYVTEPARYGDMPAPEGAPEPSDDFKRLIMNVQLPIIGGHLLMGSDVPTEMGNLVEGNKVQICLHTDSREEADQLYAALADGGEPRMPLEDQFWGDYYGELMDKFGIHWMLNFTPTA